MAQLLGIGNVRAISGSRLNVICTTNNELMQSHEHIMRLPLTLKAALVFVLWFAASFSSYAHEIKPAIVDLNYTGQTTDKTLDVNIIVNLESLMAEIEPTHDDTDESDNSARYEQLRLLETNALLSEFEQFKPRLLSGISITGPNNIPVSLVVQAVDIPAVGNSELPRDSRITLSSKPPLEVDSVRWQWSESFGEVIVRANSDSQTMDYAVLLSSGQKSDLIHFTTETTQSPLSVIANYIAVGFEHILPKGTDHILFVLGLFLLTPRWRPLVLQITTFTIAHSITLALGASKILSVSPSIVEPLIAFSIVFICIENILLNSLSRWRLGMVFIFGLLHGLGFASVLEEVGLDASNFFIALLGFNIGVELGQLLIITLCLLCIGLWFGKKQWYRNFFSKPASLLIGLIGLFWFVERTML